MKVSSKKSNLPILASLWMTCLASSLFADALSVTMTPASDQIVLKNENINFNCSPSGGCTPYTYSWSFQNATPGSSTSQSSVATFGSSAEGNENTATVTVTDQNGATASASIIVRVPKLETETVASVPSDKTRKKIGVGEEVILTLTPGSVGTVNWTVSGEGSVDPQSGTKTTFTAGNSATSSTVRATFTGGSIDTIFTVVQPFGVSIIQKPGTHVYHDFGFLSIGFKGIPYLKPNDVSFRNIQIREKTVTGEGTGYLSFMDGMQHTPSLDWVNVVDGDNDASGSRAQGIDTAEFITGRRPPWTDGMFTWPIPLEYQLKSGSSPKDSGTVNQILTTSPIETMNLIKGGTNVSKQASDPSSSY